MVEEYNCPKCNAILTFMADWDDLDEWLFYECSTCGEIYPMDMAYRPIFDRGVF